MKITLKAARVNSGLTQAQVAKVIGYSRLAVIRWENYETPIKGAVLDRLSQLYDIPVNYLITDYKDNMVHLEEYERRAGCVFGLR